METAIQVREESRLITDGAQEVLEKKIKKFKTELVERKGQAELSRIRNKYKNLENKHAKAFSYLAERWFFLSCNELVYLSKEELRALDILVHRKALTSLTIYSAWMVGIFAIPIPLSFLMLHIIDLVFISACSIFFSGILVNVRYFFREAWADGYGADVVNYLRGRRAIKKLSDKSSADNDN